MVKTHFDCIFDCLRIPHLLELTLVNASRQNQSFKFAVVAFIFQVSPAISDIPQTRMNFVSKTMYSLFVHRSHSIRRLDHLLGVGVVLNRTLSGNRRCLTLLVIIRV